MNPLIGVLSALLSLLAATPAGSAEEVALAAKAQRLGRIEQRNFGAEDKAELYTSGCHVWWSISEPRVCGFNTGTTRIVVSGDSHAAAWFPGLKIAAAEHRARIFSITKAGCPLVSVRAKVASDSGRGPNQPYPECDRWQKRAVSRIIELRPDLVVLPLLTRRPLYREPPGMTAWSRGIGDTVRILVDAGLNVVVLGDVPQPAFDVPSCVRKNRNMLSLCHTPTSQAVFRSHLDASRRSATRAGAVFVDVTDWFCTAKTCPPVIASTVVFRDSHHLTASFAKHLSWRLSPLLAENLSTAGR